MGCNHYVLYKKEAIKSINIESAGYAFQAECIVKSLIKGATFKEVGVLDKFEVGRKSRAFSMKNIVEIIKFYKIIIKLRMSNRLKRTVDSKG